MRRKRIGFRTMAALLIVCSSGILLVGQEGWTHLDDELINQRFYDPGSYAASVTEMLSAALGFIVTTPDLAGRVWDHAEPINMPGLGRPGAIVLQAMQSCCSAFVVVTCNRQLPPIIAYSPTSDLETQPSACNAVHDMLVWDLQERFRAIEDGSAPEEDLAKNRRHWEELLWHGTWGGFDFESGVNPTSFNASYASTAQPPEGSVTIRIGSNERPTCQLTVSAPQGPWLRFETWNQTTPPCNAACPLDRGEPSMAGCVALAMAQIIYHWRYPDSVELPDEMVHWETHQPQPGHTLRKGSYRKSEADIPRIDYSNLPTCKEKLTHAAGFSAETIYSSKVSVATLEQAATALQDVWGYEAEYAENDDGFLSYRVHKEVAQFKGRIFFLNVVRNGQPVILGVPQRRIGNEDQWVAHPREPLHAVIVHGYMAGSAGNDQIFYFLNSGWGGQNDCYYSLPCGYPRDHNVVRAAVLGIHPTPASVLE